MVFTPPQRRQLRAIVRQELERARSEPRPGIEPTEYMPAPKPPTGPGGIEESLNARIRQEQDRVKDLEQELDFAYGCLRAASHNEQAFCREATDVDRQARELEQQIAARDAVIERIHDHARAKGDAYTMRILDAAPESLLAEVKAQAWDYCLDEIEAHELNTEQAREGNPYRKGAGQ